MEVTDAIVSSKVLERIGPFGRVEFSNVFGFSILTENSSSPNKSKIVSN